MTLLTLRASALQLLASIIVIMILQIEVVGAQDYLTGKLWELHAAQTSQRKWDTLEPYATDQGGRLPTLNELRAKLGHDGTGTPSNYPAYPGLAGAINPIDGSQYTTTDDQWVPAYLEDSRVFTYGWFLIPSSPEPSASTGPIQNGQV
mmetsp:Transcript_6399/g.10110  ORF Transcript_6399/g.10110 Transcript_6399/m.10110 type:complete len:148 (+) Transcript_6399:132-575(+)|eukprot:CAMPEP_0184298830 /NCGR_PEP_ID=MMETSP1049-20130417/9554_1 /TAXON_ID=77928 /ORGANISM="Proteomonas sulcata, Strain CCMP704" /LENGTH=147 /DNA_ID=CAMNT_0026609075 /DNA_START=359 /DNA_END=802 /DNA_ORIENTATION=+